MINVLCMMYIVTQAFARSVKAARMPFDTFAKVVRCHVNTPKVLPSNLYKRKSKLDPL